MQANKPQWQIAPLSAIPDESVSAAFRMLKCNSWIGNKISAAADELFLFSFLSLFTQLYSQARASAPPSLGVVKAWNQISESITARASRSRWRKRHEWRMAFAAPHVARLCRDECVEGADFCSTFSPGGQGFLFRCFAEHRVDVLQGKKCMERK